MQSAYPALHVHLARHLQTRINQTEQEFHGTRIVGEGTNCARGHRGLDFMFVLSAFSSHLPEQFDALAAPNARGQSQRMS